MKVAVLDDTSKDAQRLLDYINQFQEQQKCFIQTEIYNASIDFLEEFHSQYDVIFLDIEMPGENGLEVVDLRKISPWILLFFVIYNLHSKKNKLR